MKRLSTGLSRRVVGRSVVAGLALAVSALALPISVGPVGASPSVTELASVSSSGYVAVGANGNVDIASYITGGVYQVTPDGGVSTVVNLGSLYTGGPWAATGDAEGNVYVATYYTGAIYKITPSGAVSLYASGSDLEYIYGMAFSATSGLLYVQIGGVIYSVSSSGTVTFVASGAGPGGLALNQSGTFYTGSESTEVYQTTPGGVTTTLASIPGAEIWSVAVGPTGDVYAADYVSGNIYRISPAGVVTTAVTYAELGGGSKPYSLAFDSSGDLYAAAESGPIWKITGVNAPPTPTGLVVTETSGQVSASWYGATGLSYTCTLMYGFNDPSPFSVSTSAPSCTFQGLDTSVGYGVQVVASNGGAASAPVVGFASAVPAATAAPKPQPHSIVCRKNRGTALRAVTGLHPTCPRGWHRVG